MLEESEEGVTVIWQGGGSFKSESCQELGIGIRKVVEHLRWTHLEQAQHCTDLPRQVTFPVHTEQGKMGPGLG